MGVLVKYVSFLFFLICCFVQSSVYGGSLIQQNEIENEVFSTWCQTELRNFQNTDFDFPSPESYLPKIVTEILKKKLENFDLSIFCPLIEASGIYQEIGFVQFKTFWSAFRKNVPGFYCSVCNELESKIKQRILQDDSLEKMLDHLLDMFPDDGKEQLLSIYKPLLIDEFRQKLKTESLCNNVLPRCSSMDMLAFCQDNILAGMFCNASHCFFCSLCETSFQLIYYEFVQNPLLYEAVYNLTHYTICPVFNITIKNHPLNLYNLCITLSNEITDGIFRMIDFVSDPYVVCYQEIKICDPIAYTPDLFSCLCTSVDWPDYIGLSKKLCLVNENPCNKPCGGCQ